jgi:hypothetical protein
VLTHVVRVGPGLRGRVVRRGEAMSEHMNNGFGGESIHTNPKP